MTSQKSPDAGVMFSPIAPELLAKLRSTDGGAAWLEDPSRAVYTNRDLDLSHIKWVGFDMDYTLALYRKAPMEQLQYDLTVEALVAAGYPEAIRALPYDPRFVIRGLVVDKRTGNLLKMDTHGRVGRAFFGHRRLTQSEIHASYHDHQLRLGSPSVASADTLFSMPEVCLYANLLTFFAERLGRGESVAPVGTKTDAQARGAAYELRGELDTWKLFDDVREGIDRIHRDGSLKNIIMANLHTYFEVDDALPVALHKLRSAGKRLFVLTNSHWRYTQAVMSHLLDDKLKEYPTWRQYFDAVIVGGRKPKFFTDRDPFLLVDAQAQNDSTVGEAPGDKFERTIVYQGGNIAEFERRAQAQGEEILYVGDHIFGDIVRSRRDSRWRTCLVVEELEHELAQTAQRSSLVQALDEVDDARHALDDEIAYQRALLTLLEDASVTEGAAAEDAARRLRREIDIAKRALRSLDAEAHAHQDALDQYFNPSWGRLFKASNELSRFGAQVEQYACTYTSRVSNFGRYSPVHFFRAPRERMSHDVARAGARKRAARTRTS
jgi:5'-nucleotidase